MISEGNKANERLPICVTCLLPYAVLGTDSASRARFLVAPRQAFFNFEEGRAFAAMAVILLIGPISRKGAVLRGGGRRRVGGVGMGQRIVVV